MNKNDEIKLMGSVPTASGKVPQGEKRIYSKWSECRKLYFPDNTTYSISRDLNNRYFGIGSPQGDPKEDILNQHLDGKLQLATSVISVSPEDKAMFCNRIVIDLDYIFYDPHNTSKRLNKIESLKYFKEHYRKKFIFILKHIVTLLTQLGFNASQLLVYLTGGRGGHIEVFLDHCPVNEVLDIALLLKDEMHGRIPEFIDLEIFPKNDNPTANLVSIPGLYPITDRPAQFLNVQDNIKPLKYLPHQLKALHIKPTTQSEFIILCNKIKDILGERRLISEPQINAAMEQCEALKRLKQKIEKERHLTHDERRIIAQIFLNIKNGNEYLHELFSQLSDYSRDITEENLRSLNGYKPFKCSSAKELGLCTGKCSNIGKNKSPITFFYTQQNRKIPSDPTIIELLNELTKHRELTAIDRDITLFLLMNGVNFYSPNPVSYSELERTANIKSHSTISKGLKRLQKAGILKIVEKGIKGRSASKYIFLIGGKEVEIWNLTKGY